MKFYLKRLFIQIDSLFAINIHIFGRDIGFIKREGKPIEFYNDPEGL